MKYYSEKLDQMFDSIEDLTAAEASRSKKKKSAPSATCASANVENVPSRKELANAVEVADNQLKEAYANYESAKAKVEELSKKYLEEVDCILEPAKKTVKEAERARYEAIRKFNDTYGAYQVTYTGARAADEMMKAISNINGKARTLLRDMFWI